MKNNNIFSTLVFGVVLTLSITVPAKMQSGSTTSTDQAVNSLAVAEFEKNMGITQDGTETIDNLNSHRVNLGQFNDYEPTYFQGTPESGWKAQTRLDVERFTNTNPAVVTSNSGNNAQAIDTEPAETINHKDDHQ